MTASRLYDSIEVNFSPRFNRNIYHAFGEIAVVKKEKIGLLPYAQNNEANPNFMKRLQIECNRFLYID